MRPGGGGKRPRKRLRAGLKLTLSVLARVRETGELAEQRENVGAMSKVESVTQRDGEGESERALLSFARRATRKLWLHCKQRAGWGGSRPEETGTPLQVGEQVRLLRFSRTC